MSDLPVTTTLLLDSLKDERNNVAWSDFDSRYRKAIEDFARSAGLRDDDAAEVAQQTLFDFVKAYRTGRYSRDRGRLHSWIIGIAQNKVADVYRQRGRAGGGAGGEAGEAAMLNLSDSEQVTRVWDQHLQQAVFRHALERLRKESNMDEMTIKAFELVAVRNATVESAARECGMKPSEIYVAKHRVLTKLRQLVEQISKEWES